MFVFRFYFVFISSEMFMLLRFLFFSLIFVVLSLDYSLNEFNRTPDHSLYKNNNKQRRKITFFSIILAITTKEKHTATTYMHTRMQMYIISCLVCFFNWKKHLHINISIYYFKIKFSVEGRRRRRRQSSSSQIFAKNTKYTNNNYNKKKQILP